MSVDQEDFQSSASFKILHVVEIQTGRQNTTSAVLKMWGATGKQGTGGNQSTSMNHHDNKENRGNNKNQTKSPW